MRKKYFIICGICVTLLSLTTSLNFAININKNNDDSAAGASDLIIHSKNDMENNLISRFNGKKQFKIIKRNYDYLSSINYNQKTLNRDYNDNPQTSLIATGTCAEVAAANIVQIYRFYDSLHNFYTSNKENYEENKKQINDIFYTIMQMGYWGTNPSLGIHETPYGSIYNLLLSTFEEFDSYRKSVNKTMFDLYKNIKNSVIQKKYTMFTIPGHSVIAVGYYEYTVSYLENYWSWFSWHQRTVTTNVNYVIINDGWYNSQFIHKSSLSKYSQGEIDLCYSYFPQDKIDDNWFGAFFGCNIYQIFNDSIDNQYNYKFYE